MSWNKSDKKVKSCWSQMSFMCKKFNIDIFEMRDKRDKTFAYRLVKAWPVQIVGV